MRFKVGVKMPRTLDPRMFVAFDAIERAWYTLYATNPLGEVPFEPTITSWADSQHGANSYHMRDGRAVDIRTKTIYRSLVISFADDLKKRIGALGFDVVLEDLNGPNEHLHIELDARADQ